MKPLNLLFATTILLTAFGVSVADKSGSEYTLHSVFERYEQNEPIPAPRGSELSSSFRTVF